MLNSKLELSSAHGDQTLGAVRFVLHGADAAAGRAMRESGLKVSEGRAAVTTDLIHAYGNAAGGSPDMGMIAVLAVPAELHLGYAAFTSAYISRANKLVTGAPLRYAQGRSQLAFYAEADTEAARQRLEGDLTAGEEEADEPEFVIASGQAIGSFKPEHGLKNILNSIEVSAKAFEPIDTAQIESSLVQLFDCREPAQAVLVPSMVRDVVVGAVEAVIISHLRTMRWQGLGLLGYEFKEDGKDVTVGQVADIPEQRRRMDDCERKLASSSIFTGELAWLKTYAANQLGLMRVELDGAALEEA